MCGMQVDPANASGKSDYNGKTYYFCSKACKKQSSMPTPASTPASNKVLDPVCGMTIDPANARGRRIRRPDVLLLRRELPAKFQCDPARYVDLARRRGSLPGARNAQPRPRQPTTPRITNPESRIPNPGRATKWTCPMHPEIVRDAPGSCPICGMALEPLTDHGGGAGERRAPRHDAAVLDERRAHGAAFADRHGRHGSRPAARSRAHAACLATWTSSRWRRRSCSGAAGRSSCAAGSRSSTAASTCSR